MFTLMLMVLMMKKLLLLLLMMMHMIMIHVLIVQRSLSTMKPSNIGLLILALLSAILSSLKAVDCPDNWIPFHGHCYTFSINQTSWFHATQICHDLGAQLVIIETGVEDVFLKTTIQHLHAHDDLNTVGYWTGANDLEVEGHWVWGYPSENAVRYTDWHAGEPNNQWYVGRAVNKHDDHCNQLSNQSPITCGNVNGKK
ncbi:hypothetical protein DPMN_176742 [Dreissena polymorpha]|uniref:C-type lectin domain-containing protein n=1 Tax=Dreissena polymorpha TaxID=45954 RepID=A0A9D4IH69_DREPO|nr:hypothetical protein DPMN_176742 [Dreissena polymorpha]